MVLALGDLGVFEDDADSCDCEAVGRLVAERVGTDSTRAVSLARFATAAAVLDARRRERPNALGVSGAGAPALVPPELFRNQTLMRVFMSRAGRVASHVSKNVEDVDAFRLSASQFVFWLRDAGALRDGLTEAGALVLFARARGSGKPDEHDGTTALCLCDVSLRFAPDFVAALALAATARGETAEAVAGALVTDAASPAESVHASRLRRLRACFAMLDETRAGFVRNDRLASVLAAGDAFSFSGAPRGGDLDAAAAFLRARVHERAPELGFVSTRDARDGHVSLRECEAHFLAAARSGFVPDFRAAETNETNARLPKKTKKKVLLSEDEDDFFFGVETRDASTTFERFCAAGLEAGFAAEPHPRLMDLERFERFALEARLYDAKLAEGAARVAFAAAARGAARVDVSGFFAAVAAVARHKAMSPADAVECVKRARLSGLATVGVGGNDERFAPRARFAEEDGGGGRSLAPADDIYNIGKKEKKSLPRVAPPPDPGTLRVADPGRAAAALDALTRRSGFRKNTKGMGIPLSSLACVMADVGALAGVPLVEAGAAIDGARLAAAAGPGTRDPGAEDAEGVPLASRDACARLISALADIREARVVDGAFHDETGLDPGWIPPALEMYASDARLRAAYAAWTAFGSADPRGASAAPNVAWERSVAEANASRTKKENRDPSARRSSGSRGKANACARGHDEGDPREGYVRFRVDPVASGGADWPDEAQLLGRRDASGLDRTRRARVPDARRVAFGAAHASRDAGARATARARERGDALGLPSLGTAGANEGRWEAIHGTRTPSAVGASTSAPRAGGSHGMSLDAFKTLVVQAGLTGDGRTRGERSIDAIDAFDIGNTKSTIERRPRPFTAAAAEVAFATARAGGGHDLSWGAFLDALALVASAAGRTVGDVALRVREVKRPLASSAGRAPPVPRVTYVPEPPRARGSAAADGFDVDAFARGCDDAHAEIALSAIRTHPDALEETSGFDGGVRSPPASEGTDGVGSPPRADAFFAARETSVSQRLSEETSGTHSPRFPSLASTWQNRTSGPRDLDLGTLGTSLVASLRASEYYRRSRG